MAGQRQGLLRPEHSRPGAELGLALAVVEPGVAAGDEQEDRFADPNRQRLGDPARLDSERAGGGVDRGGALRHLDQRQIGGVRRRARRGPIRGSFADQVEREAAPVRPAAVLEQIDALPGAEREPAAEQRDGELDLGEDRPQMRRHVVRPLVAMGVGGGILRREPGDPRLDVGAHLGRGILLDEQRGGGVAAEEGEQAFGHGLGGGPGGDVAR